jgi:hypothetical protein
MWSEAICCPSPYESATKHRNPSTLRAQKRQYLREHRDICHGDRVAVRAIVI